MTDRIIPACEDFGPIAARLREIEEAKRAELGKSDPDAQPEVDYWGSMGRDQKQRRPDEFPHRAFGPVAPGGFHGSERLPREEPAQYHHRSMTASEMPP